MLDTTTQSELSSCFKNGSSAVSKSYKKYFDFHSSINGSVDIDKCLLRKYPSENRWDYMILNDSDVEGYFVEIHPASTGEVSTMIAKKRWLVDRVIKKYFKSIDSNRYKIVWIATKSINIVKNSSHMRRLSQNGLKPVSYLKV